MISQVFVLVLLIALNAFFACSEVALLSVNQNKIKLKVEEGDKKAILLKKIIDDPTNFLATIQIGTSLSSLFAGAFASQAFSEKIAIELINIGLDIHINILKSVIILFITIILSYFSLVLAELVPKRIAMKKADTIALKVVGIINILSAIATPFVKILSVSTDFVLRIMNIDPTDTEDNITEEEIRMMINVGEENGMINEYEKERINNIFEFDDKIIDEIATHRKDIIALSIHATKEEIFELTRSGRYSRIPVYEDNIDNIIGILHIRDFVKNILSDNKNNFYDINLRKIIRKAYFIPSSKKADELFADMQKRKDHMAIVIDEYGGTMGLITMEDLIEAIMGNIFDEYDEEETPDIEVLSDKTYLVKGIADLDSLENIFNKNLPVDDYDTVSGFVISQLGRIPSEGEQPEIEYKGLLFKVHSMEEQRIDSIIVCILN